MGSESAVEAAERLRNLALELGFDRAGVARIDRAETADSFVRWLDQGRHAGMAYLERAVERRLDPREVLPGAKTAICVALRYWPLEGESRGEESDLWSGVARYARGRDYHDVMLERLERLERRIADDFPESATRRYVDTGPVLERDLAAKAGLGSFGKNTCLLDSEMGSWFLIGEVLTTLDLEPDGRVADLCGTCTMCLEACPTGALTGPYQLDSRLCISYWTIEHRGAIPVEMRDRLEEWVFGCDVCQEVCPANVDRPPATHPEFGLPDGRRRLTLAGLLGLDREEYVEAFRGSPMKRAKLGGLKRNAAIAMGNSGRDGYLEPLRAALEDEDGVVREAARWAIDRIASDPAQ